MDIFGFREVKISTVNEFVKGQIARLAELYLKEFNTAFPHQAIEAKSVKIEFYYGTDRDGAMSMATIKVKTPYAWLETGQKIFNEKVKTKIKDNDAKVNTCIYCINTGDTQVCIGFNVRGFVDDIAKREAVEELQF